MKLNNNYAQVLFAIHSDIDKPKLLRLYSNLGSQCFFKSEGIYMKGIIRRITYKLMYSVVPK